MPALVSSDKHAEKQEQDLLSVIHYWWHFTMSLSSRENDVDRFFPACHAYQGYCWRWKRKPDHGVPDPYCTVPYPSVETSPHEQNSL